MINCVSPLPLLLSTASKMKTKNYGNRIFSQRHWKQIQEMKCWKTVKINTTFHNWWLIACKGLSCCTLSSNNPVKYSIFTAVQADVEPTSKRLTYAKSSSAWNLSAQQEIGAAMKVSSQRNWKVGQNLPFVAMAFSPVLVFLLPSPCASLYVNF